MYTFDEAREKYEKRLIWSKRKQVSKVAWNIREPGRENTEKWKSSSSNSQSKSLRSYNYYYIIGERMEDPSSI